MPWQAKELPRGALDTQGSTKFQELPRGVLIDRLGTIQLIRYHSSPVGPYDELLYVPGQLNYKVGNTSLSGLSITRIYVSTFALVVNGKLSPKILRSPELYVLQHLAHFFLIKRAGNIPKRLARFEFTPETPSDPLSPTLASVYPSLSDSRNTEFSPDPIFRTRLVPSRRLPNFPLNLSSIPRALLDLRVLQPPLTDSIGTEQWCIIEPGFVGQVRIMYPDPGLEGARYGDGIGFPDLQPMSVGLWWPKVSVLALS
ncbi:hypothetical protein V565_110650 [Rhizoctonia solani 123E]|uniref:Uncharacterized protein n=1 Tax=Rhizoctonia solani 123E TaxID=1423351 RepID=A0A074RUI4_9AGAM|nr:hypothetical protein V565_110650 [Rhizoctonia solani 123E]